MSKCSCPNALCRCLYGCGCQSDSNNKKTERCLCCRFLSETKQKKRTSQYKQCKCDNSDSDHDYHYDDHYDDIILYSNRSYFSLRYQCNVTINSEVQLEFNTKAPSKLSNWLFGNIAYKLNINEDDLFNGAVYKDYKIICFVDEKNLYSKGYKILNDNLILNG